MTSIDRGFPRARKSLGQNFLASPAVAGRIAAALRPAAGELVLEIGPGRGALTAPLAATGASVAAFEIDAPLVPRLRETFAASPRVEIVHADIRGVDLDAEAASRGFASFKLAGNIPYNLTSTILIDLARWRRLGAAALMVQREVGERILASPGTRACGILSIFLQSYFIIERVTTVRPGSFTPPPKVMSVVLAFTPLDPARGPRDRLDFLAFLKTGFAHRRKKLRSAVPAFADGRAPAIEELAERTGIDFDARPEALALENWLALYCAVRRAGAGGGK
jgi:16S rRNA (adenine1518-N6/adenine1519-N6)-dimethyltransferase